jgi:hypothetical protein
MPVTLRVKNVDAITEQLALGRARPRIRMAIMVSPEVMARAFVWEWGRVGIQPGPKTTWSVNFDGQEVVLTRTAPNGYIRVNRKQYKSFIIEEINKIHFAGLKPSQWNPEFEKALRRAAKRSAQLIAQTAPWDTGRLREEIESAAIEDADTADRISLRPGLAL